ncbi:MULTISPECIES: hypothetical protein [Cyanophyceae]|uniref:hypothetical protein n=1 Tax=Cyanophyceae TaxID=3028117 RepID=UPI0003104931|nr:hypothetical protein [Synechococcus sp. 7002]SMH50833.1 hypothetical protein SAMN06272755_2260 [Picosynechococcus sp. OG1]SMQ81910.1 hypothetical protein SAMN06272774_1536 [Synechococcus sp. 7002]
MRILISTPRQLHIEFPEECTAQATLEPVYKEKIKSRLDKGFGFIRRHVDQASYIA